MRIVARNITSIHCLVVAAICYDLIQLYYEDALTKRQESEEWCRNKYDEDDGYDEKMMKTIMMTMVMMTITKMIIVRVID